MTFSHKFVTRRAATNAVPPPLGPRRCQENVHDNTPSNSNKYVVTLKHINILMTNSVIVIIMAHREKIAVKKMCLRLIKVRGMNFILLSFHPFTVALTLRLYCCMYYRTINVYTYVMCNYIECLMEDHKI